MKKIYILLIIVLSISNISNAQSLIPKYTFNVELCLPVAMSNEPFNDFMQGLVGVSTYGQYSFPFHLNIGAGIRYSYFTINEFSVPSPVFGGVHSGTAFMKVGWDKFHTDQFATDFGLKVGYSQTFFDTDLNKAAGANPIQVGSSYAEFTTAFILRANESSSYRWVVGYGMQGFGFTPQHIGLSTNGGYDPAKFNRITSYLVVGFGYTYYIGEDKSN
ncbi:MAG: hypothetical protein HRT58_05815 [Crocinitomicaceae bacterium]|nr:hypothetical protein [Flavobacteriales bacterium]NQZ35158.1 hypothetical protein [Crocinitomicaceae bacterium]